MRVITDEDVYRYYLGEIIVGEMYNSPIPGRKDDTPSFQLYENRKTGKVEWTDYGLTDQFGQSPANLVQYLRYLPITHKGYFDAQRVIEQEVKLGMMGKPLTKLSRRPTRDSIPYVKPCGYRDFELEFWNRFHINESELLFEDIQPLESMSWSGEGGKIHVSSTPSDPAFVYWWNRNPASWKIYRPMARKRDKFRQENVIGVIEGWNSMMKQLTGPLEMMFILSSTKDRLVVKHGFNSPWVNGINPRGEKDRQDIIDKQEEIREMSDRQIILYDADDPGWEGSQRLAQLTGFETYDLRGKLFGQKDFADIIDTTRGNLSYNELVNLIKSIIK